MKTFKTIVLFLVFLMFSCDTASNDSDLDNEHLIKNPELQTAEAKAFIATHNDFAFEVFKTVAENETEDNFMVSPLSLSIALGMVSNGADGTTKTAFEDVLGNGTSVSEMNNYNKMLIESLAAKTSGTSFDLANSIWIQNGFQVEDDFLTTNKMFYDNDVETIDFGSQSAVNKVNNWVNENTNGKIERLVESFTDGTVMFLANALYFKSQWKFQFKKEDTKEADFHINRNDTATVSMMNMEADIHYFTNESFSSIVLPYEQERFEMIVLMPHPTYEVANILENIDSELLNDIDSNGHIFNGLKIRLPRFKFGYEIGLNEALKSIGLEIAFSEDADFSKINDNIGLRITKVLQKTFIEVNEEGTEAAAATGVEIGPTSIIPSFTANRPFLYTIREKFTGAICFIGKVGHPDD